MTLGFADPARRDVLIGELRGWELDEVIVEKYNVRFLFESGSCLLNVAWRFAYVSADRLTVYRYDVRADGGRKALDVDRILRLRIVEVEFPDDWEVHLLFENGDKLIVFDQPHMRSCWFKRLDDAQLEGRIVPAIWSVDDDEPEDAGRIGAIHNRIPARP